MTHRSCFRAIRKLRSCRFSLVHLKEASDLYPSVEEVGESSASAALIELHNEVQKEVVPSTITITKNVEKEQEISNKEPPHMSSTTLLEAEFDANTGEVILWKGKSPADVEKNKESSNPDESLAAKGDVLHSKIIKEEKKNPSASKKVLAETKKEHVTPSSGNVTNAKKVKRNIRKYDEQHES